MTKRIMFLLIILIFLLSACSIGGNTPNDQVNDNIQDAENDQNTNDVEVVENTDETEADDTEADDPEYSPTSSVATCTAATAAVDTELEPYDRVKGAVEGYEITIVDYGDFQ